MGIVWFINSLGSTAKTISTIIIRCWFTRSFGYFFINCNTIFNFPAEMKSIRKTQKAIKNERSKLSIFSFTIFDIGSIDFSFNSYETIINSTDRSCSTAGIRFIIDKRDIIINFMAGI